MKPCDRLRRIRNQSTTSAGFFTADAGGQPELKTYDFEDVVATLNGLVAYDWTGFLRSRLDGVATKTPEEAVTKERMEIDL